MEFPRLINPLRSSYRARMYIIPPKLPREGVIIEWTQNVHFNDARDVIIMSRTDVREMVDLDDDHDRRYQRYLYL